MTTRNYSKATLQTIEKKILSILKKAKKLNLKLTKDTWGTHLINHEEMKFPKLEDKYVWGSEDGCCCPMGAVLLVEQPKCIRASEKHSVAKYLKLNLNFIDGFVHGYDMDHPELNGKFISSLSYYQNGYEMGARISNKLFKGNNNA